ncbi:hypothetical protein BC826DRAFT_971403 [Russula brevipes]|nr:hypothetical protein BC826DRAFT_971403 [Russula brevipes]
MARPCRPPACSAKRSVAHAEQPIARASRAAGTTHARSSQGGSSNGKTSPSPARSARRSVTPPSNQAQGDRTQQARSTRRATATHHWHLRDLRGEACPAERSSTRRLRTAGTKHAQSNGKTSPAPARSGQRSVAVL